ncbi:MAG: AraC family transcriptional regulator [Lentisphaerae bacterium]|nr:MAG: AraC family transcriptional regulator [Lentisphaerota bacterium]
MWTHSERREQYSHPAIQRALQFIHQHLTEGICVADVVREAGLSHSQLNLLFHRQFHLSIREYITRKKVEQAEYLIVHSSLPIKEIAIRSGYSDLHHFNKVIRRYYGVSPRVLRDRRG